jgi:hypothetical protein
MERKGGKKTGRQYFLPLQIIQISSLKMHETLVLLQKIESWLFERASTVSFTL